MLKFLIPSVFMLFLSPFVVKAQETFIRYISFQEKFALPDLAGKRSMESVLDLCKSRKDVQVELLGNPANDLGRRQFAFVEKQIRSTGQTEAGERRSWAASKVSRPGLVGVRVVVPARPEPRFVRVKSITEVDQMLEKMAPEAQNFTFDPALDREVVLESGSRLYIPRNSFILKKETESVELEVVEYQSAGDMIAGGLPTMTEDALLTTGGSMRVEVRADGVPVDLKDDHKAKVFFVRDDKTKASEQDDLMQLYQGKVDNDGQLVWEAPRSNSGIQTLEPGMSLDAITVEPLVQPESQARDYFGGDNFTLGVSIAEKRAERPRGRRLSGFAFPLRLGYINCDRPVSTWVSRARVKRQVFVKLKVKVPNPEEHRCYVRLHDTRTIALGISEKEDGMPEFNLPKDRRLTIIAVKIEEGEPWLAMSVTKASNKTVDDLVWKKTTETRLMEILGGMEW